MAPSCRSCRFKRSQGGNSLISLLVYYDGMKTNLSLLPEENWNKESVKCNNGNDILIFEFFIYLLNFTLF